MRCEMEANEFRQQRAKAVMNQEVKDHLQLLIDSGSSTFEECVEILKQQQIKEMEELIQTGTATLPNKCLTYHRYGLGLRWLEEMINL